MLGKDLFFSLGAKPACNYTALTVFLMRFLIALVDVVEEFAVNEAHATFLVLCAQGMLCLLS